MESLDQNTLIKILNYLDDESLIHTQYVNKFWNGTVKSDDFWQDRVWKWVGHINPRNANQLYFKAKNTNMSEFSTIFAAQDADLDLLDLLEYRGYLPEFGRLELFELNDDQIISLLEWGHKRKLLDSNAANDVSACGCVKGLDWLEQHEILPDSESIPLVSTLNVAIWMDDRGYQLSNKISNYALQNDDLPLLKWCIQKRLLPTEQWIKWWNNYQTPGFTSFLKYHLDPGEIILYMRTILNKKLVNSEALDEIKTKLDIIDLLIEHGLMNDPCVDDDKLSGILSLDKFSSYMNSD